MLGVNVTPGRSEEAGRGSKVGSSPSPPFSCEDPPAPAQEGQGASGDGAGAPTTPLKANACAFCSCDLYTFDDWQVYVLPEPFRWQIDGIEQPWATVDLRAAPYLVCPDCAVLVAARRIPDLALRLAHTAAALKRPSESAAYLSTFLDRLKPPVPLTMWAGA